MSAVQILIGLQLLQTVQHAVAAEQSVDCFTCASEELRAEWQVTSLPHRIEDALFSNTFCDSNVANYPGRPSGLLVRCRSACLMLILQEPQPDGNARTLVVRGCHEQLVGFVSQDGREQRCEAGSLTRVDAEGRPVRVKAHMQLCVGDKCNAEDVASVLQTPHPDCQQDATQPRQCHECSAVGGDCSGGRTCVGAYCTKAAGWLGDTWLMSKGCSPFNPYSRNSRCERISTTAYFPTSRSARGVILNYEGTHCFCNDRDTCNAAVQHTSLIRLTVISAFIMLTV